MNVVVLTVIVFPVLFALIEVMTSFLLDHPRQGDRKFKVFLFEGSGEITKAPLDLSDLRKEFKGKKEIRDIEVMPPGIRETNIGIDLCLGAITVNLAILLNMLTSTSIMYSYFLRIAVVIALATEFVLLLFLIILLQTWGNDRNPRTRMRAAQSSNLIGVMLLVFQFFVFGKVLVI